MVLKKATSASFEQKPSQMSYSFQDLLALLNSQQEDERRLAARSLSEYPVAVPALLNALSREPHIRVKCAILVSLQCIGGHRVLEGLLPFLRSENAALRNGVIEILQGMPNEIAHYIEDLLEDPDSDVRIFAIDILQTLAHPKTPQWLLKVISKDPHINVVATALDRLTEVGTPEMKDSITAVKQRFPNEPYIDFVVTLALKQLAGA